MLTGFLVTVAIFALLGMTMVMSMGVVPAMREHIHAASGKKFHTGLHRLPAMCSLRRCRIDRCGFVRRIQPIFFNSRQLFLCG